MRSLIFAANWKMHHGPTEAQRFLDAFLPLHPPVADREVWFFPPAVSLATVARAVAGRADIVVGAQDVYWEPNGAFTGETSIPMARDAGATAALVGHSERRHVFGETDAETGKKIRAVLEATCMPVLCVGETIEEREAGNTLDVIHRQLDVLAGLDPSSLAKIVVAYEPVWAIGTGRNATPSDAAEVHGEIRTCLGKLGGDPDRLSVLYGGSVKPANVASLVAEAEIDGALVGGASLTPDSWAEVVRTGLD